MVVGKSRIKVSTSQGVFILIRISLFRFNGNFRDNREDTMMCGRLILTVP